MRLPSYTHETDEGFHRRLNRLYKETMEAEKLADMDLHVLSRMYDHVGHTVRSTRRVDVHLTGAMMNFRDSGWKKMMTLIAGHQGHNGRVHPWNW